MKLLAFDTSTEACSAALLVGDKLIYRYELALRRHAELILDMIDQVLAEAGLAPAELDALAFGCGPGSFTGLRIAASVAQGIAFAAALPVAKVSTLAALACGAARQHNVTHVASALDARMGEVYWGLYQTDGSGLTVRLLGQECVSKPDAVPLAGSERRDKHQWYGVGSGWGSYGDVLRRRLPVTAVWTENHPSAVDIARLGAALHRQGDSVAPEYALPVYLRDRVTQGA